MCDLFFWRKILEHYRTPKCQYFRSRVKSSPSRQNNRIARGFAWEFLWFGVLSGKFTIWFCSNDVLSEKFTIWFCSNDVLSEKFTILFCYFLQLKAKNLWTNRHRRAWYIPVTQFALPKEMKQSRQDAIVTCSVLYSYVLQARSQVLRFEVAKYIWGGVDFWFHYMFQTHFYGHKKFELARKSSGGNAPECNQGLWVCCTVRACFDCDYGVYSEMIKTMHWAFFNEMSLPYSHPRTSHSTQFKDPDSRENRKILWRQVAD